jgi:Spy/CpxP family protein refolding chaperone
MKLINKTTIIAALIGGAMAIALAFGGVALAHGAPHGGLHGKGGHWTPEKIEEHLTEMTERLDLSSAQQQQIRAILEQAQSKAREIKEMPRGKEKFLAFRDLHFATEDQIHAKLSCEQREELRLLMREHKVQRMEERFERRSPANND